MTEVAPSRDFDEALAELLAEAPDLRAALEEADPEYQVAREVIGARLALGISQAELARRTGTTQSVISRIEQMDTKVTLRTLQSLATALGRRLEIRLVGADDPSKVADTAAGADEVDGTLLAYFLRLQAELNEILPLMVARGSEKDADRATMVSDVIENLRATLRTAMAQAKPPSSAKAASARSTRASRAGTRTG